MFKKEKKITHRDKDEGVKEALIKAQQYSDDPVEQFLWLKNNTELSAQQKVINMVDLIQMNFNVHTNKEIKLYDGHIDMLMRAFGDALRHMQEDLPSGVYTYLKNKSEDTLEDIIKQKTND